jgi:hypothetical protein
MRRFAGEVLQPDCINTQHSLANIVSNKFFERAEKYGEN